MQRLPKDIPHREILMNAGFVNYAVLRNHRSFESIRGLTPKQAKEVTDYIFGGKKESSKDYTISELRDMDLSDKGDSFFEDDERASIEQIR